MAETGPTPDEETGEPSQPRSVTGADVRSAAFMGIIFVVTILLALLIADSLHTEVAPVVEDPEDPANSLLYLGLVVVFTLFILLIARLGFQKVIQYVILGAVFLTMVYVYQPLLATMAPGLGLNVSLAIAVGGPALLTGLLYYYPEWYVVDLAGIFVAAGATGLFGFSFGLLPALVLLVAFAVYDFIAVYRTKHMLDLADQVLDLRLPVMLVIPKVRGYSFLQGDTLEDDPAGGFDGTVDEPPWEVTRGGWKEDRETGSRDALFMGLGDIVIPGVLVVSSFIFLQDAALRSGAGAVAGLAPYAIVSLATLVGATFGFAALMWAVLKGKPHAGLPALNGGALTGFLIPTLWLYGLAPLIP